MALDPLTQQNGGRWLLPFDGAITASRFHPKDVAGISFPAPTEGIYGLDPFYERAAISFPPPTGGDYRSTFRNLGSIGTDNAGISYPPPSGGFYQSTLIPLAPMVDEAAITYPLPTGGDYRETLLPLAPMVDEAAITYPPPTGGSYDLP